MVIEVWTSDNSWLGFFELEKDVCKRWNGARKSFVSGSFPTDAARFYPD